MPDLAAGSFQEQDVFVEWTSPAAAEAWHEEQLPHDEPVRTIITPDGFKLNRRKHDTNELFDLGSDPAELNNLAGDSGYQELEADLSARIDRWKEATNDTIEV
jgi:hypothetical protein